MTPEQEKSNLRMALILASVALAFFIGFMARVAWSPWNRPEIPHGRMRVRAGPEPAPLQRQDARQTAGGCGRHVRLRLCADSDLPADLRSDGHQHLVALRAAGA